MLTDFIDIWDFFHWDIIDFSWWLYCYKHYCCFSRNDTGAKQNCGGHWEFKTADYHYGKEYKVIFGPPLHRQWKTFKGRHFWNHFSHFILSSDLRFLFNGNRCVCVCCCRFLLGFFCLFVFFWLAGLFLAFPQLGLDFTWSSCCGFNSSSTTNVNEIYLHETYRQKYSQTRWRV